MFIFLYISVVLKYIMKIKGYITYDASIAFLQQKHGKKDHGD